MTVYTASPKAAQAIRSLPGVESLEREGADWVCHLRFGWTTEALGGGGTIIDSSLKTIRRRPLLQPLPLPACCCLERLPPLQPLPPSALPLNCPPLSLISSSSSSRSRPLLQPLPPW